MWVIRYTPLPWRWKQELIHVFTPKIVVAGLALVPDGDGRILLLRARYSGRWILPGGALHQGEDPLEGTRRECREELGREVEIERLVGVYAIAGTRLMWIVFRCAPLAGPPRLSPEHEVYRYACAEELPPRTRAIAADAARQDGVAPVVRTLR